MLKLFVQLREQTGPYSRVCAYGDSATLAETAYTIFLEVCCILMGAPGVSFCYSLPYLCFLLFSSHGGTLRAMIPLSFPRVLRNIRRRDMALVDIP